MRTPISSGVWHPTARRPPGRWRRGRQIAALAAAIALIPALASYARMMVQPSDTSLGIRTVEWLRGNGARRLVNDAESFYYSLNAPAKGGPAPGIIEGVVIERDDPHHGDPQPARDRGDNPGERPALAAMPSTLEREPSAAEPLAANAIQAARALASERAQLESRLDALLERQSTHEPNRKLLAHLARERKHIFTFLTVPGIQATNWRAEQAIRPAVLNRKSWGGNRTWRGAHTQQIAMSVIRTARQQQLDPIELMASAQRSRLRDRRRPADGHPRRHRPRVHRPHRHDR